MRMPDNWPMADALSAISALKSITYQIVAVHGNGNTLICTIKMNAIRCDGLESIKHESEASDAWSAHWIAMDRDAGRQ